VRGGAGVRAAHRRRPVPGGEGVVQHGGGRADLPRDVPVRPPSGLARRGAVPAARPLRARPALARVAGLPVDVRAADRRLGRGAAGRGGGPGGGRLHAAGRPRGRAVAAAALRHDRGTGGVDARHGQAAPPRAVVGSGDVSAEHRVDLREWPIWTPEDPAATRRVRLRTAGAAAAFLAFLVRSVVQEWAAAAPGTRVALVAVGGGYAASYLLTLYLGPLRDRAGRVLAVGWLYAAGSAFALVTGDPSDL